MAALSYFALLMFLGWVINSFSDLGNLSYIITVFCLPSLVATFDKISDGEILKCFKNDWIELSPLAHILIIINIIIYCYLSVEIKKLWNQKDLPTLCK